MGFGEFVDFGESEGEFESELDQSSSSSVMAAAVKNEGEATNPPIPWRC